jgi:hypothetical protein
MIFTILVLLSLSIQNIDCQPTIPRHFDVAIRQLRDYYYNYQRQQPNLDSILHTAIKYDRFLENISFSGDNTIPCERDMEILIEAATNRQLWALKVLDSWGKPLPSGLLKGNLYWSGDYDECIEPLYQYTNKSFLKQPFNTRYCE